MSLSPPTRDAFGKRGVVAAPHHLAAEAGAAILDDGGNALDAAVAAAATIAVVYPHMNGIGGDSFWLVHDGRAGRVMALNAAGRSAEAATLERYRARFGDAIPTRGGAAALTVPGTVAGWDAVHRYSREALRSPIAWPMLLERAIAHACDGFPISAGQRRVSAAAPTLFGADVDRAVRASLWPLYHPDHLGRTLVQRDLGASLSRLADAGAADLYRGTLAVRLVEGARAVGSPLNAADLAVHRAVWVEPLRLRYRGGEAASFPPPTQGFAALAILGMLEGFEMADVEDADYIHLTVEATKLAFADRDRYLTDPTVEDVPVGKCLDRARLAGRARHIARRRAMSAELARAHGDTIAIVAADAEGNAVSVIQSLYHEFGAGVVAADTGVILQNRGAFFSLDPVHVNRLAPHKQTAHTLVPSMYLANGRPRFVYGTMGGEGQPQTQAALVTRLVDRGLSPQAAVDAPRWLYGRTWGDASSALRIETRFGAAVTETLRERGHPVEVVDAWSDLMGHAQVAELTPEGLRGGSDARADGAAVAC